MDWVIVSALVSTIGIAISAFAFVCLAVELGDGRRFMKAQLINELEREYRDHYSTYTMLLPGQPWSPEGPGPGGYDDLQLLEAYLEFFEKLSLIIETRALDLRSADRLYAFRFLLAMNNPHVEKLIHRDEPYWPALLSLHTTWTAYRVARGLPILNREYEFRTSSQRANERQRDEVPA